MISLAPLVFTLLSLWRGSSAQSIDTTSTSCFVRGEACSSQSYNSYCYLLSAMIVGIIGLGIYVLSASLSSVSWSPQSQQQKQKVEPVHHFQSRSLLVSAWSYPNPKIILPTPFFNKKKTVDNGEFEMAVSSSARGGTFTPLNSASTTNNRTMIDMEYDDYENAADPDASCTTISASDNNPVFVDKDRSITLHFIFLVHGHRGYSTDLSYLQRRITSLASARRESSKKQQHLIVHAAVCNEGKTNDGIQRGGERLVQEIFEVIQRDIQRLENSTDRDGMAVFVRNVTLSMVGNSLGGLYSRYAVSRLKDLTEEEYAKAKRHRLTQGPQSEVDSFQETEGSENLSKIQSGMSIHGKQLFFNVFCTTASPHLGVADQTYIKIPRTAEVAIAYTLGDTGRDLFRVNHLLRNMGTSPYFLEPLSLFRKRIAYANAYSTDFVVPTETAAFLNPKSTSLHRFVDHSEHVHYRGNRMIVATLHTDQRDASSDATSSIERDQQETDVDELVEMSQSLDALGWKKVFVDVSDEIPIGLPLPRLPDFSGGMASSIFDRVVTTKTRGYRMNSSTTPSAGGSMATAEKSQTSVSSRFKTNSVLPKSLLDSLRSREVVQSKELVKVLSVAKDRLSLPIGHNMIVAHTKKDSKLSTAVNKRGRPVMNSLAQELVDEVLLWV